MSNEAGKDLTPVNTDNQEAKDQPAVEQNTDPAGLTVLQTEQPRSGENVRQKAPKTPAEPSRPNPSRKRAAGRGEASGGGGASEESGRSRQGYTSLRMRAENHPDVVKEKKSKGGKPGRSEDK